MTRSGVLSVAAGSALVFQACDSAVAPKQCALPEILSAQVSPSTTNVLAATASIRILSADSVSVRYIRNGVAEETPGAALQASDTSVSIAMLGLHSSSTYEAEVLGFNACGTRIAPAQIFSTGPMPADLPAYATSTTDTSHRYIAFATGNYGVVIDNTGRIVWYHRFPNGPGLNFQAQQNGRYVARPGAPAGQIAPWVEIDVLGNVTRTLTCAGGKQARFHDILVLENGSYWLLCDEVRTVDLSAQGRSATSLVTGTGVQHVSPAGAVLFEWSPFDHMDVEIATLDAADLSGSAINWTHGNSIDIDVDGNVLISYRNLDEVLKIDSRTGAIIWRLGGNRNQFALENTLPRPFRRQHSVRSTGNGELHLLDNLGHEGPSRFERYQYDEIRKVAKLVSSHASSAGAVALTGGTVQRLPGDRTLVSFGSGGNVEEVDRAGSVVWRISGNPGYVFRAQRINSLYKPGATGEAR